MDFIALLVFIVVQILFIPLAIVGFILVTYKQCMVVKSWEFQLRPMKS